MEKQRKWEVSLLYAENKNERDNSGRTNPIGSVIYAERISRYMKGKFVGEFRNRRSRIWISGGIFFGIKKGV